MASSKMEFQLLTFIFGDEKLEGIECNIEVDDESLWKKIDVYSRDFQLMKLQGQQYVDVKIIVHGGDKGLVKLTEVNEALIRGFNLKLGHAASITFSIFPKEVYIHQQMLPKKGKRKAVLRYFINKAPKIAPYYFLMPNEKGEVKKEKGDDLHFNLRGGEVLISQTSFYYQLKGDHFESNRYQVLSAKFWKKKDNIEFVHKTLTPQVDDFLMLTSLLHDSRVTFRSWELECDGLYTWYYKSQALKSEDIEESRFRELVDRNYTREFLDKTLRVYQESQYKHSIDNAIYALMIDKSTILELSYLSNFQALESMILTHKRLTGVEFNFSSSDFKEIRKGIERFIDSKVEDKNTRKKIKDKLGELRRVSLKDAAFDFFEKIKVPTENIWPLFDDKQRGITGLNTLRNVLVHGDLLPSEHFESLAIANYHLRTLLIRCIFSLLEWDISKTKVSSQSLVAVNFLFSEKKLESTIADIHKYFAQKNSR